LLPLFLPARPAVWKRYGRYREKQPGSKFGQT
jgi:hypothetical protein